jgi:hypothetical protein
VIRAALAAVLLLAASACTSLQTGSPAPLAGTRADETAMASIEAGYEVAARSYLAAVTAGLVAPGSPIAARVADIDARIQPPLELLRRARRAGDSASVERLAAELAPLMIEFVVAVNAIRGGGR